MARIWCIYQCCTPIFIDAWIFQQVYSLLPKLSINSEVPDAYSLVLHLPINATTSMAYCPSDLISPLYWYFRIKSTPSIWVCWFWCLFWWNRENIKIFIKKIWIDTLPLSEYLISMSLELFFPLLRYGLCRMTMEISITAPNLYTSSKLVSIDIYTDIHYCSHKIAFCPL